MRRDEDFGSVDSEATRRLLDAAEALPRSIEPDHDLWPRIAERIRAGEEVLGSDARASAAGRRGGWRSALFNVWRNTITWGSASGFPWVWARVLISANTCPADRPSKRFSSRTNPIDFTQSLIRAGFGTDRTVASITRDVAPGMTSRISLGQFSSPVTIPGPTTRAG